MEAMLACCCKGFVFQDLACLLNTANLKVVFSANVEQIMGKHFTVAHAFVRT